MKIGLCVGILTAVSVVAVASANGQSKQFEEGTIVNVQKQDVATPSVRNGADPARGPLQSHSYHYNVSVQLNCEVYDLRYESELDDLPSELSANNRVPVRLKKNVMYLDFPGDTLKMRVIHHKVSGTACQQSGTAK